MRALWYSPLSDHATPTVRSERAGSSALSGGFIKPRNLAITSTEQEQNLSLIPISRNEAFSMTLHFLTASS